MKLSVAEYRADTPLSTNRKIFRAAVVVGTFTVVAKVGATAKELVVARWFGRGDVLDAFLIAFLLPSFFVNLVAGSFHLALIPTFIQVRETEGREAAQRLFSSVTALSLGILVGLSILLGLTAPYYLRLLGSGFSPAKLALTRDLTYLLLPIIVLGGLEGILVAILNAEERFALPAFLPVVSSLLAVLSLFAAGKSLGIFALALGTVVGQAVETVVLLWALRRKGGWLGPRWTGMDPNMRQVVGQYAALVAGSLLMGSTNLVDQSMAAMLDPGSVAALNYANKLVSAISGTATLALSSAALPYFSQMVASQDWKGCRHTLKTYFLFSVAATVPVTLGLLLWSHPLIKILFQRGAFTERDTNVVSATQAMFAIQIPFYVLGILLTRVIASLKRNDLLMCGALINLTLDIILNLVLMKFFGVAGIALSTSLVYIGASCYLTLWVLRLTGGKQLGPMGSVPSGGAQR
ncbi:MAG: murein biosynthesis integral membrane protein MurJ [Cyanobacteria bacterium 13_1_40CM_2_61_4]|nr:MAG: murein biosynthesis integral membrane protein MurJ [Cyanobacteria bacterium 13_1_40CM_2_61_4]